MAQWTRSFSLVFRHDCVWAPGQVWWEHEQGTQISPKTSGTDDFSRTLTRESLCSPFSWAALALSVREAGVHIALSSDVIRGLDRTDF